MNYILCVVTDPEFNRVVGLTKKKGPKKLINKVTFPGGKIEDSDSSVFEAASREMAEESGLIIQESAWKSVMTKKLGEDELTVVHAFGTPEFARQLEEEPIWDLDIKFSIEQAKKQPDAYAADFVEILEAIIPA